MAVARVGAVAVELGTVALVTDRRLAHMPTERTSTTVLALSADDYWKLRIDRGFDEYCAVADNCTFTLHAEYAEPDENGDEIVVIESTNAYAHDAVPGWWSPACAQKCEQRG